MRRARRTLRRQLKRYIPGEPELILLWRFSDLLLESSGKTGIVIITCQKTDIIRRISFVQILLCKGYFFCIDIML